MIPQALSPAPVERFRHQLWVAALGATLLKMLCAALTLGSVDVGSFCGFGEAIARDGLAHLYRCDPLFNHMPLIGAACSGLYELTGGTPRWFAFFWRLPSIGADLLTLWAVLRVVPLHSKVMRGSLLLFVLSPVSFMVSGFHGNVDPIMVAFLTLAAVACVEEHPARCALFFACACNIKAPALLLAPAFFFFWMTRAQGLRFTLSAGALLLAGWAYALILCPAEFLSHVLGYGSYWGIWGVTYVLWLTGWEPFAQQGFSGFSPAQLAVLSVLKLLVIAWALGLAWKRRARPGIFQTLSATWLVFMVFAPGVAAQYLVWPAPFLLVAAPRAYRWATLGSTVHLVVFYTVLCGGFPWYFGIARAATNPIWMFSSCTAWLGFCAIGWRQLRAQWRTRHRLTEREPISIPSPQKALQTVP